MQPQFTTRRRSVRWLVPASLGGLAFLLLVWCFVVLADTAPSSLFPLPDVLRPNVTFWKRVFAVFDANGGLLHDTEDVSIVYHIWYDDLPTDPPLRQGFIDEARTRYRLILDTLADGKRFDLTSDEQRVWELFKGKQYPGAFRAAANNMRFQGGMRSRFAEGLVRSWSYLPEIEQIFVDVGLPLELTRLPHIESSFENRALSKVGAAGIWQIMPATGRRFLRVDGAVDERLNIPTATLAAARLLRENYETLGTWPLAITAYNHGANGMKQAVATVGTTDFGIIVQRYRGPLFGFASQNFYAEFLAALDVVQNYKQYFGDILFAEPSRPVTLEARAVGEPNALRTFNAFVEPSRPVTLEARAVGELNPTMAAPPQIENRLQPSPVVPSARAPLPPPVVSTPLPVVSPPVPVEPPPVASPSPVVMSPLVPTVPRPDPVGPRTLEPATPAVTPPPVAAAPRPLPVESRPLTHVSPTVAPAPTPTPPRDKAYRVRPGDTLFAVAQRHGTTVATLAAMNGLSQRASVKTGQMLRLPDVPQPVISTEKTPPQGGPVFSPVKTASALPVQRPVLSEVTHTLAPAQTEDRFQVKGETIRVAAQEQLSQYAAWLDVPVQRLLTLNRLSLRQSPPLGAAVRLDFSKVSATQFTQRRLQYQRSLEEEFLRRHRIGAVVTRKLKSGETLLSVSRTAPGVPLWLLQRYNTHLDLNAPRPGTELRIPKVVTRAS
jgi:membrane-bound lytic murein transglycosylase D